MLVVTADVVANAVVTAVVTDGGWPEFQWAYILKLLRSSLSFTVCTAVVVVVVVVVVAAVVAPIVTAVVTTVQQHQ